MRKLLFGVAVAALAGGEAVAQAEPDVHALNARAHAEALKLAWFGIEDLVRRRSTAAVLAAGGPSGQLRGWPGDVPPATLGGAGTGWLADWTRRGVRARYCTDDPAVPGTLLVWLDPARPMGVGTDHRSVRAAPRLYGRERRTLHWLDGGVAEGGDGRAAVTLPACMTAGLPSGRAALAGAVEDPWVATVVRSVWERRDAACPAGTHRPAGLDPSEAARVERRRVDYRMTRREASRPRAAWPAPASTGPWRDSVNLCEPDIAATDPRAVTETATRSCTYTIEGQSAVGYRIVTRKRGRVGNADVFGPWTELFSTCRTGTVASIPPPRGTPETLPAPRIAYPTRVELAVPPPRCGDCFDGTVRRWRRHTDRHARFEWDSRPTVQLSVRVTNWVNDRSQCTPIPPTVLGTVTRSASAPARCPPGQTGTASKSRNETYRREIPCGGSVREIFLSATGWVTDTGGCRQQVALNDPDREDDHGGGEDYGGGEGDGDGGEGEGEGDGEGEGGLGDGEDAAVGGDGLGSETADPSDDGVGSMGGDGSGGGDGDGGGGDC